MTSPAHAGAQLAGQAGSGAAAQTAGVPGVVFDHVDHVAIAVHDADEALAHYTDTFGLQVLGDEIAHDPGVRLIYLDAGNTMIQLISPVRDSPVSQWLAAHGDGLHHICFRVDDIEDTLKAVGGPTVPTVFMGGRGRRACFLTDQHHGVNVELTEREPLPVIPVVLDDDPTGSQCAHGIDVALDLSSETLSSMVAAGKPFFVVTNIRALPAAEAADVLDRVHTLLADAARKERRRLSFIARGDSTLRGHLATEVAELATADGVVVLVPAFPAAERITARGVHHVRVDGSWLNAADTEFARDPQLGYAERDLVGYVQRHLPGRLVVTCAPERLADVATGVPPGAVVIPDILHDGDIWTVAAGIREAQEHRDVLVRTASPLAAVLTGSWSEHLLPLNQQLPGNPQWSGKPPAPSALSRTRRDGGAGTGLLVVCGSHTHAATRQLSRITGLERPVVELDTDASLNGSATAATQEAANQIRADLTAYGMAVLATARERQDAYRDLASGARLMEALCATVAEVRTHLSAIIVKGGISSVEVTRTGLGAPVVTVLGQLEPGVSLWQLRDAPVDLPVVSVPGNIGDDDILRRLVHRLGYGHTLPGSQVEPSIGSVAGSPYGDSAERAVTTGAATLPGLHWKDSDQ